MFAVVARWLRSWKGALLGLLAVVLALVAYYPLIGVYFWSDDFVDMVAIENRGASHFLVSTFGGHMIFFRNLEVYLVYRLFGAQHPEGWCYLMLATHLVNVALLFRVLRTVIGSDELGALGAALWGTSPMLSEALGWIAVYGQVLSGTLLLVVLGQAMARQTEEVAVSRRSALLWCFLLLLGAMCFGGAMAAALAFPVAFFLLFERRLRSRPVLLTVAGLPVFILVLYFGWHWVYGLYEDLPPQEGMLRAIATSAVLPPFQMLGYLYAVGTSSLLRGYAFVGAGYPTVIWWLTGFAAALAVSAFTFGGVSTRRRAAALLTLNLAIYAMIALGRANVYRMFAVPMSEAARQLRYHYTSTIPLVLLLAVPLGTLVRSDWMTRVRSARFGALMPAVVLVGWLVLNGFSYAKTTFHIRTNDDCRKYVSSTLRDIEHRIDAAAPGSNVLIPNEVLPKYCTGFMGYDAIPGWAALFILFHPSDTVRGRHVSFVELEDYAGYFDHPKNERLAPLLRAP